MKKHNFGAGPGILPQSVLEKSAASILDLNGIGLSVLEISHRSKEFEAIIGRARQLVIELLGVPDGYSVLFLQGGASTQFAMVPMNLLPDGGKAAYLETGVWATKAIKEARLIGTTEVVATSRDRNFSYIPKGYKIPGDAKYFHITSNNTIYGTQVQEFSASPVPVVCDMSSDIFSKPVDVSKFDLIYAGAQKNMGPAGTTLVIIRDEIVGKTGRAIPTMLDYKAHIENESMYNTPPVFAIYVCMETLEWLKSIGGVPAIQKINEQKAGLLYDEIDRNSLFTGTAEKEDRSLMNVCFLLSKPELEEKFNTLLKENGIVGLKGHRSVGGFRASLYNALPVESVQVLANLMKQFEDANG